MLRPAFSGFWFYLVKRKKRKHNDKQHETTLTNSRKRINHRRNWRLLTRTYEVKVEHPLYSSCLQPPYYSSGLVCKNKKN